MATTNSGTAKNTKKRPTRLLRTTTFIGWIISLLLVSCASQGAPAASVSPTTAAPISEPSPTELPPLTLDNFSIKLEGVGTHGTMACFTYEGDINDLKQVTLTATISQGDRVIDKEIPAEIVDGKNCFELVDARYVSVNPKDGTLVIPDGILKLAMHADSSDGRQINNNNQLLTLGKYIQYPFLTWVFPMKEICGIGAYLINHTAWDFEPKPNASFETLVSIPIFAPANGEVVYVEFKGHGSNVILLYSSSTGYMHFMKHSGDFGFINEKKVLLDELKGIKFDSGEKVSTIGLPDAASSGPHLHWSMTPNQELIQKILKGEGEKYQNQDLASPGQFINYVKQDLFLNSEITKNIFSAGKCGNVPWGEPELFNNHQQVSFNIDGKADEWAGYTPIATDPVGDSETGKVMDFSALYTASDENYFYLMVKAGINPAPKDWVIHFLLDTNAKNNCETVDRLISIESGKKGSFYYDDDYTDCGDAYSGAFAGSAYAWKDILEVKIPRIFMGDIKDADFKIVKVRSYLQNQKDVWSNPDEMP